MTIDAGARLGSYDIVGPLGAGGMGEVYRARDSKLKREVAIKVLPETFADNAERVARLRGEPRGPPPPESSDYRRHLRSRRGRNISVPGPRARRRRNAGRPRRAGASALPGG